MTNPDSQAVNRSASRAAAWHVPAVLYWRTSLGDTPAASAQG